MQGRSEREFLAITDHHHLARVLYELGQATTYCEVLDNLSSSDPNVFWKYLQDKNEVYLRDRGDVITPAQLPTSVKDLRDDPFRSLAGAVREARGFTKEESRSPASNYLEFKWADYLRENWSKTNIPVDAINANLGAATNVALQPATQKEAIALPGYTGKTSCH
jgi:hypothetical protein